MVQDFTNIVETMANEIVKKLHNIHGLTHKSVQNSQVFLMKGDTVVISYHGYLTLEFEDGYINIDFNEVTKEDIFNNFTPRMIIDFYEVDGIKVGVKGDIYKL